jgi:hypothetical protein
MAAQVIWQVTRAKWIADTGHNGGVDANIWDSGASLSANEDGTVIYVGNNSNRLGLYNVATGANVGAFVAYSNFLVAMDSDAAGNLLSGGLSRRFTMYSPPGANSKTTSWESQGGQMALQNAASVNDWNLY